MSKIFLDVVTAIEDDSGAFYFHIVDCTAKNGLELHAQSCKHKFDASQEQVNSSYAKSLIHLAMAV